jgi:hypothetical protein
MIRAAVAVNRDDFARKRPEPPLHPVSDDGIADLLCDGESDAHLRVLVAAIADEEHEPGHRRAPSGVRREKIRALLDDC